MLIYPSEVLIAHTTIQFNNCMSMTRLPGKKTTDLYVTKNTEYCKA